MFPHVERPISSRIGSKTIIKSFLIVWKRKFHGKRSKFCGSNIYLLHRKILGSSYQVPMANLSEYYPPRFMFLKNNIDVQLRGYTPGYGMSFSTIPVMRTVFHANNKGSWCRVAEPPEAVIMTRKGPLEVWNSSRRGSGSPPRGPSAGPSTQRNGSESPSRD